MSLEKNYSIVRNVMKSVVKIVTFQFIREFIMERNLSKAVSNESLYQTSNLTTHQGINTIVNQVNGYMGRSSFNTDILKSWEIHGGEKLVYIHEWHSFIYYKKIRTDRNCRNFITVSES